VKPWTTKDEPHMNDRRPIGQRSGGWVVNGPIH
jgi:hypothetical protein